MAQTMQVSMPRGEAGDSAMRELEQLLCTWRPSRTALVNLRGVYARALNEAVAQRCLELVLARERPLAEVAPPEQAVVAARSSTWTRPDLAFAHYVALRVPGPSNTTIDGSVASLLDVCARDIPPTDFEGVPHPVDWKCDGLATIIADHRRDGHTVSLHATDPAPSDVEACHTCVAMLRRSWPEMAAAIDALIRHVVWFRIASRSCASTQVQAFGAVFLAVGYGLTRTLEHLVHETTHLELVARMAVDPLIINARERASSPFRKQPRPLSRILHAAVVSRRVVEALDRTRDELAGDQQDAADAIRQRYAESLTMALVPLEEAARWTPTGGRLFETLRAPLPESTSSRHAGAVSP